MIDLNDAKRQGETRQPDISAEAIRDRLNLIAESFVRSLFGGRALIGKSEARIGNIRGEAGTSLSIELSGANVGLWHDHATGDSGDLISLYRSYMGYPANVDFILSLKEIAREFLGDQIQVDRAPWQMPRAKIEADKATLGTKPAEMESEPLGAPVAEYKYLDVDGSVIAGVTRYEPKTFRPWCFRLVDGAKKWVMGAPDIRPLYHLPEVSRADRVVLVEGEGKADALAAYGVVTTSVMGGAKAANRTNWLPLGGKTVVIWPDNDKAGQDFARDATAKLTALGCRVWMVPIPVGKPDKWDAGKCIREGGDPIAVLASAVESHAAPSLLGWDAGDDDKIPPPRGWLLGTSFCRGFASSLLGEGAVGKTAMRYAQVLSLAVNRPLTKEHVFRQCRVLVLSFEDGPDELRRRLLAARLHHKIERHELKGWMFLEALGRADGKLLEMDDRGWPKTGALAARLEQTIIERRIDLVMLDPFIKTHGMPENDNNAVDAVAQILTDLAIKYDIAVDVPHHMAKGPADPGNANRGRGASSLKDALRLVRTITRMTPEEAKALGVEEKDRVSLVRIDDAKVNITPMGETKWFHLVGVDIGNASAIYPHGDNVQTVEPWTPPPLFSDISVPAIHSVLDEIDAGLPDGNRFTDAPNAGSRAAWSLIVKYCPGKAEGSARQVIKTWVGSGLLTVKDYENPATRKSVKGLWVDNAKRPS